MSDPNNPIGQLWISDASPLFFYSPADVYFAGQGLSPWVGHDGGGPSAPSGNGSVAGAAETTSWHEMVGDRGKVILPQVYATSFTPIFYGPAYNWSVQTGTWGTQTWESGQAWRGAQDPAGFRPQTVTLSAECVKVGGCAGEQAVFWGADIETRFTPDGSEMESATLDDVSPVIRYSDFAPLAKDYKVVELGKTDVQGTLSMTDTPGATADISFYGASVLLRGVTCPSCGSYTITLDNATTTSATLSSQNNATVHNSLMYFATDLDTSIPHTLTLVAQGGVVLDQFEVRGPKGGVGFTGVVGGTTTSVGPSAGSPTRSNGSPIASGLQASNGGTPSAGVIVGAVLGSLAALGVIFWVFRRIGPQIKKPEKKKLNPWDEANLLQNMKNEEVHVTTAANQRYVYPGLIAHSDLKK